MPVTASSFTFIHSHLSSTRTRCDTFYHAVDRYTRYVIRQRYPRKHIHCPCLYRAFGYILLYYILTSWCFPQESNSVPLLFRQLCGSPTPEKHNMVGQVGFEPTRCRLFRIIDNTLDGVASSYSATDLNWRRRKVVTPSHRLMRPAYTYTPQMVRPERLELPCLAALRPKRSVSAIPPRAHIWYGMRESNPRHSVCKTDVLSLN